VGGVMGKSPRHRSVRAASSEVEMRPSRTLLDFVLDKLELRSKRTDICL